MTLYQLFDKYHARKRSCASDHFAEVYERYWRIGRERVRSVLEIGVAEGGSVQAFRDYFPSALISGVDNDPRRALIADMKRIALYDGDQTDVKFLGQLCKAGPWDIIIDDGGHEQHQQITSFTRLWRSVRPGGWYAVEDVQAGYWPKWGGGLRSNKQTTFMGLVSELVDCPHYEAFIRNKRSEGGGLAEARAFDHSVAEVHVHRNLVLLRRAA